MNSVTIVLISFGHFENELLDLIVQDIEEEFQVPVRTREGHLDLSEFYDSDRRQYNGFKLLKEIDARFASDDSKTIGLFDVDLFIPILTYIFGQAYLKGRSGIASVFRLRNERYGLKEDEVVLLDRLRKEVVHELGHAFGLIHCHDQICVMRSSTYVEDIDQKGHKLCGKCRSSLI
jgi:archaemetzincin